MKNYLELALKKEKKPASFEKLVARIERLKSEELMREVHLTDSEKAELRKILDDLVQEYEVYQTPSDNFVLLSKTSFRKGRFYGDRNGGGRVFVSSSYTDRNGDLVVKDEKYEIIKDQTNGAIDGDFVLIDTGCKGGFNRVEKVLDRKLESIPGEVYRVGASYFVRPVDKRKQGITIALQGEAIEGQRVAVSLDEQTAPNFYVGSIVRVFNHKDDPNEDILWEAFKMGVDNEFSNESYEQLDHMSDQVRDVDRIGREDYTMHETFTLDGITTKDMDDAISCYVNERGNYVLGVHITDMATLIPYGSPLDRDGFRKGNSYYPGGIVLPNYPRQVSNGIGSLNMGVDRLTISDILEITPEGKVVSYRLVPSVIHSQLKMDYDTVNQILKDGIIPTDFKPHENTLKIMRELASVLHHNRMKQGSSDFDRAEVVGKYSSNGHINGVGMRVQDVAENLIEEFMLIANDERARFFAKNGIPCIYRVHDAPSVDKIQNFLNMLDAIGLPYAGADADTLATDKQEFQKLINHVSQCGRLSGMLLTELIKTQSRAKFSAINSGHNGLGKKYYQQGTSPARRYGDKTNQHIAWDCIFRPDPEQKMRRVWEKRLPEIAEHITHTERVADDLEKNTFRMQCAEYMEQFVGQEFEGIVTGVSGDCLNVQLDNMIEGTVRVYDLPGTYVYSPESYSIVSLDNHDNYVIGDQLRLRLKSSSKETKKIDFEVLGKISETQVENADMIHKAAKIKARNEIARRAYFK